MKRALPSDLETYMRLKWPIFPVQDKRPLVSAGYKSATVDPRKIEEWVHRFPGCGWAVGTGQISGVMVIDVDGPEGERSLQALAEDGILISSPLQVLTGRGRHLYFKHDKAMKSSVGRLGPGLDVRADGGSATVPPSIHASGKRYEWSSDPEATPLPHLPLSALLFIFKPRGRPSTGFAPSISLSDLVSRISSAQKGTRNHELNATSFLAGKLVRAGKVSPEDAEHTLVQAALSIGLDRHESIATVRSGLRAGQEA